MCTAERAGGYKPDGSLFRYLLANAGVERDQLMHCGQSQFTDMVGAKPLGITVAWINWRGITLNAAVPKPDFELPDIQSLSTLVGEGKVCDLAPTFYPVLSSPWRFDLPCWAG